MFFNLQHQLPSEQLSLTFIIIRRAYEPARLILRQLQSPDQFESDK